MVHCVLQVAHNQGLESVLVFADDRDNQHAVNVESVAWVVLCDLMDVVLDYSQVNEARVSFEGKRIKLAK